METATTSPAAERPEVSAEVVSRAYASIMAFVDEKENLRRSGGSSTELFVPLDPADLATFAGKELPVTKFYPGVLIAHGRRWGFNRRTAGFLMTTVGRIAVRSGWAPHFREVLARLADLGLIRKGEPRWPMPFFRTDGPRGSTRPCWIVLDPRAADYLSAVARGDPNADSHRFSRPPTKRELSQHDDSTAV